jgi:hypothetical protein
MPGVTLAYCHLHSIYVTQNHLCYCAMLVFAQPILKLAVARHQTDEGKKELERKCSVASPCKLSILAVLLQGLEEQSSLSGIRRKKLVSEMGKMETRIDIIFRATEGDEVGKFIEV